jgi:hypothetical protein
VVDEAALVLLPVWVITLSGAKSLVACGRETRYFTPFSKTTTIGSSARAALERKLWNT